MKREENSQSALVFPNMILNLDFNTMTLTTLKETVSNSNLTGNASSNNMEFLTDQDFGTCVHFKNSNGSNVFSCTYNSSTFPSLYSVISDATKPMSMVVIGDYSEMTNAGSYGRWGFLCSYGVKQLSACRSFGSQIRYPVCFPS